MKVALCGHIVVVNTHKQSGCFLRNSKSNFFLPGEQNEVKIVSIK